MIVPVSHDTLQKTVGDCHNQSADWFRNDIVFLVPGAYTANLTPVFCEFAEHFTKLKR